VWLQRSRSLLSTKIGKPLRMKKKFNKIVEKMLFQIKIYEPSDEQPLRPASSAHVQMPVLGEKLQRYEIFI
jgi:hypothetical protein